MGYLDNSSITIDAILTLKGRELLAKGTDQFKITQFALGDDEIDYSLWNTDHPLGSAYYGTIIDNMPILEAVPDETQALKYKLITLPKNTKQIPIISVASTALTIKSGASSKIVPSTTNGTTTIGNSNYGYTAILSDTSVATLTVAKDAPLVSTGTTVSFTGDSANADATTDYKTGLEFSITAKQFTDADRTATVTIIGNETGGSVTVKITVKKVTL
jgi:hypothetical protein